MSINMYIILLYYYGKLIAKRFKYFILLTATCSSIINTMKFEIKKPTIYICIQRDNNITVADPVIF